MTEFKIHHGTIECDGKLDKTGSTWKSFQLMSEGKYNAQTDK